MASNSLNSGIQKTNKQNISNVQPSNVRNDFDRSYPDYMTADFCHVTPFFHEYTVPGDSLRLRPSHIMRTHTLASPLFTNVQGHKAFFSVPMKVILPHTWDRFFVNPTHGDDVPEDILPNFDVHELLNTLFTSYIFNSAGLPSNYVGFDTTEKTNPLTSWHYLALTLELLNNQNLLSNLGIRSISHFRLLGTAYAFTSGTGDNNKFYFVADKTPTDYFNEAIADVIANYVKEGSSTLVLMNTSEQSSGNLNTVFWTFDLKTPSGWRSLFDFLLTHTGVYMSTSRSSISVSDLKTAYTNVVNYGIEVSNSVNTANVTLGFVMEKTFLPSSVTPGNTVEFFPKFNIDRLIAYHMVCAQYFTNSQIDNIYTADLWRQAMMSFWYYAVDDTGATPLPRFEYNGVSMEYDLFSEKSFDMILRVFKQAKLSPGSITADQQVNCYNFLVNLFSLEKSLVYGDYFTGSRLEPLAVGDTQVRAGSYVDVVDITKGIVKQRFLNKVNRLRSDIVAYSKGIFGITPESADSIPEYLAALDFSISNEQVDNTAENQGSIVTNMVSTDSGSFQLTFDATEDTIIIGVLYFTLPRVYSAGLDRYLFRRTRFDYFQPDLQNVGDQEIYLAEYDPRLCQPNPSDNMNVKAWNAPFSYREQDAEYKQRTGVAAGGFITRSSQLASWANVFDLFRYHRDGSVPELSDDLIRNRNEDFDKFYSSLSNVVPGMYYHFIFAMNNNCEIIRNMYYQPEIL